MPDQSETLLTIALEIRDLIRLMAEPAIAQRDEKLRSALRQAVGKSAVKAAVVLLMDGTRSQVDIRKSVKIDQSDLSKFVKTLRLNNLMTADEKPRLVIPVPHNFFDSPEDK